MQDQEPTHMLLPRPGEVEIRNWDRPLPEIQHVEWSDDTLFVHFHPGCIVRYPYVPRGVFEGLRACADRIGFFEEYVRNQYFGFCRVFHPSGS